MSNYESNESKRNRLLMALGKRDECENKKEIITYKERVDRIPASMEQRRLWLQLKLNQNKGLFHIPHVMEVEGEFNYQVFRESTLDVVNCHESLRTTFYEYGGELYQNIHPEIEINTNFLLCESLTNEKKISECVAQEIAAPFDLIKGPLIRLSLLSSGHNRHYVVMTMHHLISDGWSLDIVLSQVWSHYKNKIKGSSETFTSKELQYADYALCQKEAVYQNREQSSLEYWAEKLRDTPNLNLPFAAPRKSVSRNYGDFNFFSIDKALQSQAEQVARKNGTTLFTVLLAAWRGLLADYSGQRDFCIGTTAANRVRPGSERIVGFFANLLALRTPFEKNSTFSSLIQKEHITLQTALKHQDVSFDLVVNHVIENRDIRCSPLFQCNFVFQNTKDATGGSDAPKSLKITQRHDLYHHAQYDITLFAEQNDDGISCCFVFDVDLFFPADIANMVASYKHYLSQLVERPDTPVFHLDLLETNQKKQLDYWQKNQLERMNEDSIRELFAKLASAQPEKVALCKGDYVLDYQSLYQKANQLARHINSLGVEPGGCIGICLECGVESVVSMLAILNAGCAYVPIDAKYPDERIQLIIEESAVDIIITNQSVIDRVDALQDCFLNLLVMDEEKDEIAEQPHSPLDLVVPKQMAAYVMFTSGTTGKPKGVIVPQEAVLDLAYSPSFINVTAEDVFLQFAPISFDASTFEIWTALLNGATLAFPEESESHIDKLSTIIDKYNVTILWLTSGLFSAVVENNPNSLSELRFILGGGDTLSVPHVKRAKEILKNGKVVNGYGPTETTTFATTYTVGSDEDIGQDVPLGEPIQGTALYVLDSYLNPLPPGSVGDIYIGGTGLAHGYIGQPDITASAFLPDPFSSTPGSRMYRSGDLGRWRHDGKLCYLGRRDRQVKWKGFRIDLSEIEYALLKCKAVSQVFVDMIHSPEKKLVAYVSVEQDSNIVPDDAALLRFLRGSLPDYMIPARFFIVEDIPLTSNGKIDRAVLHSLSQHSDDKVTTELAEKTELQQSLKLLWKEILGRSDFGIHESFFDLGGDSLLAIRLKANAQKQAIHFDIQDLFVHQTIEALSTFIETQSEVEPLPEEVHAIELRAEIVDLPQGVNRAYPLSQLQLGMLYHSLRYSHSSLYHDVIGYEITQPFQENILTKILDNLVQRHSVLRTAFELNQENQYLQFVHDDTRISLKVTDLTASSAASQAKIISDFMDKERFTRFDISSPSLLRCFVFVLGTQKFKLIWSFHHAALDGWSEALLTTELLQSYIAQLNDESYLPAPLETTYQHFIELEQQALASSKNKAFWMEMLAGAKPTSLSREWSKQADVGRDKVEYFPIQLEAPLVEDLRQLASDAKVPLKSVLLAGHLNALSALSGQRDVLTSTVMNVRPETHDADQLVGLFLNSIPFRHKVNLTQPSECQVKQVFEQESAIFGHRFYPSQKIHQDSGVEMGDILFNFTNFHVYRKLGESELTVYDSRDGHAVNSFPIQVDFSISAVSGKLQGIISYRSAQFSQQQIEEIAYAHNQAFLNLTGEVSSTDWLLPQTQKALTNWGTPKCSAPSMNFSQQFSELVQQLPNALAIIDDNSAISYSGLAHRINSQITALVNLGVKKGDVVAVNATRSSNTLISVLALFQLGAIYLPLDPTLPKKRIQYILNDAKPVLVVGDEDGLSDSDIPFAKLDKMNLWHQEVELPDISSVKPTDPAYILYTSGSTGRPKGVLCRQEGILSLFEGLKQHYSLFRHDRVLWKTSMSFDVSLTEMLWPLLNGSAVVIAKENGQYDARYLCQLISEQQVTVVNFVPSMLHEFIQCNQFSDDIPLRVIFSAGEQLLSSTIALTQKSLPDVILFNAYGPTEASIYSSIWRCQDGRVKIGKALGGVATHILAPDLSRLPVGTIGELYLSGHGLASGYVGNPSLTAERFLSNPYRIENDSTLYRTGDLVRFDVEGNIEFIGRADSQVKVRGFRIEVGEVESILGQHPSVLKVAVMKREQSNNVSLLCAFVETISNEVIDSAELKAFVSAELPSYMIPDKVIFVPHLPVNNSGKIDRAKLGVHPIVDEPNKLISNAFNQTESKIAEIWSEALGESVCDTNINFFDVGGNSIALLKCQALVNKHFGINIEIDNLFTYTTIGALAKYITSQVTATPDHKQKDAISIPTLQQQQHQDEVAIIGIGINVASAVDADSFWSFMVNGCDGITRCDHRQLHAKGFPHAVVNNPQLVAAKGELTGADCFDAKFFGYTPREAEIIDPQLRKLLEESYRALEDAGYAGNSALDVGVFVSMSASKYLMKHVLRNERAIDQLGYYQINALNQAATQIAYRLNLTGPAITLDTACSSSLVSMHMASNSILSGDCDMALAGGSSIDPDDFPGYLYEEGGIFSSDGYCRAFDAKASGTVPGAGIGVVVLKRHDHALRDGDNIYAVIKGSAINNDGREKAGYTAPSPKGQEKVINAALSSAKVDPSTISFVETHGTGTILGDPIEISALKSTYGLRSADNPCLLGAIKTSIGHLDSAAGVVGAIKTALVLNHQCAPGTLHFNTPNPLLSLKESPLSINTQPETLSSKTSPLRGAVSSFGIGGTNAHLIMEAPNPKNSERSEHQYHCLRISAKTSQALQASINLLSDKLSSSSLMLEDIAYTLQVGRCDFSHRAYLVAETAEEAMHKLHSGDVSNVLTEHEGLPVVFMFTGQGELNVGIGKTLYAEDIEFREALNLVSALFKKEINFDIKELMFNGKEVNHDTFIVQPILFAYEYALYQTWISMGVKPTYLIGHSLGEIVAACCAGVFSLEDAVRMISLRATAMQEQKLGLMVAVSLAQDELLRILPKEISLAAVNGPTQCVISGDITEVVQFEEYLQYNNIVHKRLPSSHAFHSPMMKGAAERVEQFCDTIPLNPPSIPFISNVTGKLIEDSQAVDKSYWAEQILQTVHFSSGVKELSGILGEAIWLEIGPNERLSPLVRSHRLFSPKQVISCFSMRVEESVKSLIGTYGQLWSLGADLSTPHCYREEKRQRVPLPTYSFEPERHWLEGKALVVDSMVVDKVDNSHSISAIDDGDDYCSTGNVEMEIIEIWQDYFGHDHCAADDNFFDLGGDSLLASRIVNRIREQFDVNLPMKTFFEHPTPAGLATNVISMRDEEKKEATNEA